MFKNPFSFKGRIRRTEFGLSYLIFLAVIYGGSIFFAAVEDVSLSFTGVVLAGYWLILAQGVKRAHDMGHSGFYILIPFYVFALLFMEGDRRNNSYGPDPKVEALREKELGTRQTLTGAVVLEGVSLPLAFSELLSTSLLAQLLIVMCSAVFDPYGAAIYWIEMLVLVLTYYLLLQLSHKGQPLMHHPGYYLWHRGAFAVCFLVLYNVYLFTFDDGVRENYGAATVAYDLSFIVNTFIITYAPYALYKYLHPLKPLPIDPS